MARPSTNTAELGKFPVSDTTPLRARIYARDSKDRDGTRASPDRQIAQARDLIRARGWIETGEPVVDSSMAASRQRTTTRPGYLGYVESIMRGEFDVAVAHHDDRMWRTISEREAFMWAASDAGLTLVATCYGDYPVDDPDSDFRGELNVMLSKREAATLARRVKSKHVAKAAAGEWPGGPAPFGYEIDTANKSLKIVPAEQVVVVDAVRRLLAGESRVAVARDLGREHHMLGLAATLSRLVLSPTIAGLRVRDGEKIEGKWDGLITVADHERLVAMFAARKRGPRHSTASVNVLAGFLICELCGSKLTGGSTGTRHRYACPVQGLGGCGRVSVPKRGAEARVLELVCAELDSDDFANAVDAAIAAAPDTELAAVASTLAQDRTQLGVVADMLADGDMSREAYTRAVKRLEGRISEAEATLARAASSAGPVVGLVGQGDSVRAEWELAEADGGYSFADRRAILAAVAEKFIVHPSTLGNRAGPYFDVERITMVPRFEKPRRRRTRKPESP